MFTFKMGFNSFKIWFKYDTDIKSVSSASGQINSSLKLWSVEEDSPETNSRP